MKFKNYIPKKNTFLQFPKKNQDIMVSNFFIYLVN